MKKQILFILFLLLSNFLLAQQTEIRYLSGTGAGDTGDWDFFCSNGMNSEKWTKIAVPSCWKQQGFGGYNYSRDKPEDRCKETGTYRYQFTVPGSWKFKQINLVFDGVMTEKMQHHGNTPNAHVYLDEHVRLAVIIGNSVEGG